MRRKPIPSREDIQQDFKSQSSDLAKQFPFHFLPLRCKLIYFIYSFDLIFGAAGRVRPRTGCIGIYLGQDFCLFNMGEMLDIALRAIWGDAVQKEEKKMR
jgi:hypothetical protein